VVRAKSKRPRTPPRHGVSCALVLVLALSSQRLTPASKRYTEPRSPAGVDRPAARGWSMAPWWATWTDCARHLHAASTSWACRDLSSLGAPTHERQPALGVARGGSQADAAPWWMFLAGGARLTMRRLVSTRPLHPTGERLAQDTGETPQHSAITIAESSSCMCAGGPLGCPTRPRYMYMHDHQPAARMAPRGLLSPPANILKRIKGLAN
jgi:hypothetical protein